MSNNKNHKMTQHDKIEAERALAAKQERADKRKRAVMTVFVVILCVLLIFAFCFPALSLL